MQKLDADLSPELRFLLACVAARLAGRPLPAPPGALAWNEVAPLVRHHKVQLVVGDLEAPAPVRAALSEQRKAAAGRVLRAAADLARIARRLDRAAIEWLAFKGAAMAVQLYGSPLARFHGDIDLLVPPRAEGDALRALKELGYGVRPGAAVRQHNAVTLLPENGGLPIELHTRLAVFDVLFPHAAVRSFANAVNVDIGGAAVRTLEPAATVAYAAWHGAKHRWSRLAWLVDIAVAARLSALDWPRVAALAFATRTQSHLAYSFAMAQELLGAAPPAGLALAPIAAGHMERLRRYTANSIRLARPHGSDVAFSTGFVADNLRSFFILYPTPAAKAAVVLDGLTHALRPSDSDRAVLALPRRLDFLNYFIRPFRVVASALRQRL